MSEIQVGQINSTDGSTAITTGADGYVSFAKTQIGGRRNMVTNGDAKISQRGDYTSASTYSTGAYWVDRWKAQQVTITSSTVQHLKSQLISDGWYANTMKIVAGSTGTGWVAHRQILESDPDLTSGMLDGGRKWTLSAWVKSNNANARLCIYDDGWKCSSTSHTGGGSWERLTYTFTGSGSSSYPNPEIDIAIISSSHASVSITSGDYIEITGVQLEVGTVASPFEHISYGESLALCQRYYQVIAEGSNITYGIGFWWNSGEIDFSHQFQSEMRSAPSLVQVTGSAYHRMENHGTYFNGISGIQYASTRSANFYVIGLSGGTAGYAGNLSTKNSAAYFAIDAEL